MLTNREYAGVRKKKLKAKNDRRNAPSAGHNPHRATEIMTGRR
jgi:hypothetical protein